MLAFVAYPHIISGLPWGEIFGLLFFLMLLTLAIDSAFSLVEAVTPAIREKFGISHRAANFIVCGLAFLFGVPMVTGCGLFILDTVDYFMNSFGLTLVVLGETLFIGWYYGSRRQRDYISRHSSFQVGVWWDICIRVIVPAGIVVMMVMAILERIKAPYEYGDRGLEFVFGWLIVILLPILGLILAGVRGKGDAAPLDEVPGAGDPAREE
jgi:NSS family neurotransmitter:Na+ symporter